MGTCPHFLCFGNIKPLSEKILRITDVRRKEGSFVILGWRQAEGLVALIITGKVFVLDYVAIVI